MMQITEARWSPSVRRIALTTAGFLPDLVRAVPGSLHGPDRSVPVGHDAHPGQSRMAQPSVLLAADLRVRGRAVRRVLRLRPGAGPRCDPAGRRARAGAAEPDRGHPAHAVARDGVTLGLRPRDVARPRSGTAASSAATSRSARSTRRSALLSIFTIRANARGRASIPPDAVQDVAKLQFAMSILWMYFFWSQYLVIWYGNVPVETRFFVQRVFVQPWMTLAWVVLIVGWLIPFAYLLERLTGRPPQRPRAALRGRHLRAGRDLPGARLRGVPIGLRHGAAAVRAA